MEKQKQDRRIRRTQRLLKDSLIELMEQKEFKNISVKDITELADLNRGTFYLHYTDTYHLLRELEADVLQDFQQMITSYTNNFQRGTLLPILTPVIDYIEENTALCKVLFENTISTGFYDRFRNLVHENGGETIRALYPRADQNATDSFFEFITYGLIGMIRQWHNSGKKLSKAQFAQMADKAIMGAAQRMLES